MTRIKAQGYDILVGPLSAALGHIGDTAKGATPVLVSEPKVFGLHGSALADQVGGGEPILLPEGETAKDWTVLERLLVELSRRNISRDTPLIALGGGTVGDVTGLAASLFKRGCPVIHVPTTLLSQADSAVGGKTAIDFAGEKNLIGTFHQPALVIADPAFLSTLDSRQMRAGYAEIVKYGLIDDPAFFHWCEANGAGVVAGHQHAIETAITHALRAKARIVGDDVEDKSGKRALLNLGHSFGHAIESEAGLGRVLHGEAVALGTILAFRFSASLGLASSNDADRITAHFASAGLPTRLADVGVRGDALLNWIAKDKKNSASGIGLILARGIGNAYFEPAAPRDALAAFLVGL
nr:3-dehydroquinate synthase family protein [uncultured Sphingomonas sp.]